TESLLLFCWSFFRLKTFPFLHIGAESGLTDDALRNSRQVKRSFDSKYLRVPEIKILWNVFGTKRWKRLLHSKPFYTKYPKLQDVIVTGFFSRRRRAPVLPPNPPCGCARQSQDSLPRFQNLA